MWAWRIPRWVLPAALGGVLAIAAADAILMRHHRVSVRPPAIPEKIGLHADAEGAGLRVQWDRGSRPVRNADHAVLFIEDGTLRSQLDLTGRQLHSSSVMYWPQSPRVAFRLEIYSGSQSSSDSADIELPQDRNRRRQAGPARAVVEQARPSPFEHGAPAHEESQTEPAPVVAHQAPTPEPAEPEPVAALQRTAVDEPSGAGRLDRIISRIPLLRRLRKHPPTEGTEPH